MLIQRAASASEFMAIWRYINSIIIIIIIISVQYPDNLCIPSLPGSFEKSIHYFLSEKALGVCTSIFYTVYE